jgi:hypothetical protein
MEHGNLYSLIPLADFKVILGIDDREDCLDFASMRNPGYEFLQGKNSTTLSQPPSLAAFCLITAIYTTIEQYCKRRLLRWKNTDYLTFTGPDGFFLDEEFIWPHAVPHFRSNTLTGSRAGLGGGDIFNLREYPVLRRRVASGTAWGEGAERKITTEGWH